jgi:hypothetical protein
VNFNHCAWVAFKYVADNSEDEKEAEEFMNVFLDSLLESVEELGL